ncbi:ATP-binding cassette domain-containing protein [Microbacterium sp. NPDC055903]
MPEGQVLEFDRVTKRFGDVTAVSEFSGRVEPGVVTGFLGPNGAGKTTTLRMLLGMIKPSSGSATIAGAHYSDLKHPARVIGAMPEDPGFRPRRSVERHLSATAKANGIPLSRVDEVIRFVGLGAEAESRIATLSLGMRQRLSAATALLGDPGALVLDEPANGLDPEGIRWMRMLIRGLADEGRTVLVSSHVLSEVEQVADDILVIARGQRKFAGSLATLADPAAGPVVVDALDREALEAALVSAGFEFEVLRSGLTVRGSDAATIGALSAKAGVALTTLQQRGPTLEDVFLDLVNDRPVQFRRPEPDATVALPVVAAAVDTVDVEELPSPDAQAPVIEDAADTVSDDAEAAIDHADATNDTDAADEATEATEDAPAESLSTDVPTTTFTIDIPVVTADHTDADATAVDDAEPAFAPVEARPLPGIAGLAAAAAAVTAPGAAPEPANDDASSAPENGEDEETPAAPENDDDATTEDLGVASDEKSEAEPETETDGIGVLDDLLGARESDEDESAPPAEQTDGEPEGDDVSEEPISEVPAFDDASEASGSDEASQEHEHVENGEQRWS